MDFWLGFIGGLFTGAIVGLIIAGLCEAAARMKEPEYPDVMEEGE